jgi:putative membrane protein
MMWWGDHGMGWGAGWGFFGIFHVVLWWLLIVVLIVALVRWIGTRGRHDGGKREDSALRILRERYARGEIGKEEFDQRRKDLGG